MSKPRILVTGPIDDYSEGVLGEFGELVFAPDTDEKTLLEWIDGAVALAVRGIPPISVDVINRSPDLKVIGRTGVGYSNVDIAAATARKIPVINTPGAGARAVAEASITFMLTLVKLVPLWDRELKAGNWKSRFENQGGDLEGATLGIVGLGAIGQEVAHLAGPFGMNILAYDPYTPPEKAAEVKVRLVSLDELIESSDFICLHCAETDETRGFINRENVSRFRRGAYLVNLARGGIVESLDVLHEALLEEQLAGVGLDVFEPEPPDTNHPIFKLDNCIVSPHSMATTKGAMKRVYRSMADDMAAVLRGERPRFVVNPEVFDS
jgi:D-3-phosphoglycerate dehydrogenase